MSHLATIRMVASTQWPPWSLAATTPTQLHVAASLYAGAHVIQCKCLCLRVCVTLAVCVCMRACVSACLCVCVSVSVKLCRNIAPKLVSAFKTMCISTAYCVNMLHPMCCVLRICGAGVVLQRFCATASL